MYSIELEQPERANMVKVITKQESNQEYSTKVSDSTALIIVESTSEAESVLQRAAEKIVALNARSGAHAFDLGATLAEAKPLLPEKGFKKWLRTFSDYTVRSAWNYISIHERLQGYREQLLSHAVMPTVMFELAKGEPAQIEAVIARMADGERIRVKDVREMLGREPSVKSEAPNFDIAGVAGLRKVAAAKIEEDIARFKELMASILKDVETALKPLANKKRVLKEELSDKIAFKCRHAHDLLNSIAAPLQPEVTSHLNWRAAKLPKGTVWRKVQELLHRMGGATDWAKGRDFVPWLQNEVVPLMRFVVHGEAIAETEAQVPEELGDDDLVTSDIEVLPAPGEPQSIVEEMVGDALKAVMSRGWYDRKRQIKSDREPSELTAA